MTEILTQAEIDELLNAINSGDSAPEPYNPAAEAVNVRAYNFRTANRFPKEQIRSLKIVFESFAQLFTNKLGSILRTSCDCELLSIEELSFGEFNNSLPMPVVLVLMNMQPLKGNTLLGISPEAAYMLINRLLGGTARNTDSSKQFTEIEIALIERVLRQSMPILDEAWEKVISVRSQVERLETSPQFAQIAALSEAIAVATLEIRMGDESGLFSMCMPRTAIEPVAKQLNTKFLFSGTHESSRVESRSDYIEEKLVHSKITCTAYFDETVATVSDIVNLQVGDVIRLSHKIGDPIKIKLQHIDKFKAAIGTSGSNYAVQIVEVIKGESQDDDNVAG